MLAGAAAAAAAAGRTAAAPPPGEANATGYAVDTLCYTTTVSADECCDAVLMASDPC